MDDTPPPTPPMVPERTFNSTLRRFFDTPDPDPEPILLKKFPVSRNSSAIWGVSASTAEDGRVGGKKIIAMRRLKKVKSSLNLSMFSESKSPNTNALASTSNLLIADAKTKTNINDNPTTPLNSFPTHRGRSHNVLYTLDNDPNSSTSASATSTVNPSTNTSASSITTHLKTSATATAKPAASTNTTNSSSTATFELTPLSALLKQSFADMEMLKGVYARGGLDAATAPKEKSRSKQEGTPIGSDGRDGGLGTEPKVTTSDFESVSRNLQEFENFYKSFLSTKNEDGTPRTEVHLIAMVCKRSEVVKGRMNVTALGSAGAGAREGIGGGAGEGAGEAESEESGKQRERSGRDV